MRIVVRYPVSELVHVRLANNNGAGASQPGSDLAVRIRNKLLKNFRPRRGANSARPEIVFERNRYAVERAKRLRSAAKRLLRAIGFTASTISQHGKEGINGRVQPLDSFKRRFHQIDRRDFPTAQQPRGLLD